MEAFFSGLLSIVQTIRIQDFIDIFIIAYIIYQGIRLIRNTRAEQLIKGIVILLIIMQLANWFELNMVKYILQNTFQVGLLAILIVFQPELRRALEQMGRSKFGKIFAQVGSLDGDAVTNMVEIICGSFETLSKNRIGALVVIEQDTRVSDIVRTGVSMDCIMSKELLVNIFVPNTPLHDGAVIIRDGKIFAAACFLPLTSNSQLSSELGTRHRAAIGMSETSDAIVLVVSEETGKISFATDGALTRNLNIDSLRKVLLKMLMPSQKKKASRVLFWKAD